MRTLAFNRNRVNARIRTLPGMMLITVNVRSSKDKQNPEVIEMEVERTHFTFVYLPPLFFSPNLPRIIGLFPSPPTVSPPSFPPSPPSSLNFTLHYPPL